MAKEQQDRGAEVEMQYNQFGTFGGVFTPSILTILGVIMFMRTGVVIGEAGIMDAVLILVIAHVITFLTGLSISAVSTNTRVKGGGAYFLISRSLGPEFGGAIGLALFFAQALSVPFYILGFVEAIVWSFDAVDQSWFLTLGLVTTTLLFIVNLVGSSWAIRAQYVILAALVLAILSFLIGATLDFDTARFSANWSAEYTPSNNFWSVFAIFFPAVTGILTGVNMSGDLKDPARSIPRGTMYAIAAGFTIYLLQILLVGGAQTRPELLDAYNSLLGQALFGFSFLVIAGVMAATLSSALGSFMGAPRILQALARDNIFPSLKFFAKGTDQGDEPRRAMILTAVMTVVVLFVAGDGGGGGALNAVATVLSMFFLYTYGMTNLAAFIERFSGNPSFRPRFRYFHWMTALLGGVGCFGVALLIDPLAALAAGAVVLVIFIYISRRVLQTTFGDARRGFFYDRVRSNLLRLAAHPPHPKNWRPTALVLSGHPAHRLTLTTYAIWFASGRGIVTMSQIIVGDVHALHGARKQAHEQLASYIEEEALDAFPKVVVARDLYGGINMLIQSHSLGPLEPNLVVMGWPSSAATAQKLFHHVNFVHDLDVSQVFVHDRGLPENEGRHRRIDVWWRGNKNGSLMLILAYLLSLNWNWRGSEIRLLRMVRDENERVTAQEDLNRLLDAARIPGSTKIIVGGKFDEALRHESLGATLVFLGFQPPGEGHGASFFEQFAGLIDGLPTTMLVCSCGEVDLTA